MDKYMREKLQISGVSAAFISVVNYYVLTGISMDAWAAAIISIVLGIILFIAFTRKI